MNRPTITRREIDAALAHASTDIARFNLNSVHVSRREGWTRIESTDGKRLIRIQHYEPDAAKEYAESLNPQDLKTASKLVIGAAANPNARDKNALRAFALSDKDNSEEVKAEVVHPSPEEGADNYAEASAILRTVSGRFPDTDMVLPDVVAKADDYVRVCLNPEFLIDAAKAIKALCNTDKFQTVQLHIKNNVSPVILTAEHYENGTRVTVVVMPIRDSEGVTGAPYPEREEEGGGEE